MKEGPCQDLDTLYTPYLAGEGGADSGPRYSLHPHILQVKEGLIQELDTLYTLQSTPYILQVTEGQCQDLYTLYTPYLAGEGGADSGPRYSLHTISCR